MLLIVFAISEKIASDAFHNLNNLENLILKKNIISIINEKHFKSLKSLTILDLASNKIQNIHQHAFRTLSKVSELHLSQNLLRDLPENLFIEMGRLKKLMLFSNDCRFLHSNTFVGLRFLFTDGIVNSRITVSNFQITDKSIIEQQQPQRLWCQRFHAADQFI